MNTSAHIQLQFKHLNIGYHPGAVLLTDIQLTLHSGDFVCLVADNGVGKSTLLKTIAGFIKPLNGEILLNNQALNYFSGEQKAKYISVVLTDKLELFNMTVSELVSLGRIPKTGFLGRLNSSDMYACDKYMEICGISALKNRAFNEISDGEKQKALIAKALAQETPVMLLDEPTAFLDFSSKNIIIALLKNVCKAENKIVLFSSHDLDIVCKYADFIYWIEDSTQHQKEKPETLKNKFQL